MTWKSKYKHNKQDPPIVPSRIYFLVVVTSVSSQPMIRQSVILCIAGVIMVLFVFSELQSKINVN